MDENTVNEVTSLEVKHRKERKELQGQIQALKKIAKNDKTKKKELTTEIIRLESELENRHKEELQVVQKPSDPTLTTTNIECEMIKMKISKAQKRRDKKTQQSKIIAEEIKQQEKDSFQGPRSTELKVITEKLRGNNLKLYSVPSDGDCLYRAVIHQLQTKKQKFVTVDELRQNVADYIRHNKENFFPYMTNPDSNDILTDAEFEAYCDKIKNTKMWGGLLELEAISKIYKCAIAIIQGEGPDCMQLGTEFDGPVLIVTYHRHMYTLGEHYNSTQTIDDNTIADDNV